MKNKELIHLKDKGFEVLENTTKLKDFLNNYFTTLTSEERLLPVVVGSEHKPKKDWTITNLESNGYHSSNTIKKYLECLDKLSKDYPNPLYGYIEYKGLEYDSDYENKHLIMKASLIDKKLLQSFDLNIIYENHDAGCIGIVRNYSANSKVVKTDLEGFCQPYTGPHISKLDQIVKILEK